MKVCNKPLGWFSWFIAKKGSKRFSKIVNMLLIKTSSCWEPQFPHTRETREGSLKAEILLIFWENILRNICNASTWWSLFVATDWWTVPAQRLNLWKQAAPPCCCMMQSVDNFQCLMQSVQWELRGVQVHPVYTVVVSLMHARMHECCFLHHVVGFLTLCFTHFYQVFLCNVTINVECSRVDVSEPALCCPLQAHTHCTR